MIDLKRYFWPLLIFVALFQSGAVAKIAWDRSQLLQNGREIILPVVPVDPRDIFRGDYVILGYGLSPIAGKLFDATDTTPLRRGDPVYLTLSQGAEGAWTSVKASSAFPASVAANEIVLRGRITSAWGNPVLPGTNVSARFGVESYFVPEGTGVEIEQKVRDSKVQAILAISASGEAALKGLVIDGQRKLDPSLF